MHHKGKYDFFDNNLSLEGAMKLIFVSFCLSWAVLATYKI